MCMYITLTAIGSRQSHLPPPTPTLTLTHTPTHLPSHPPTLHPAFTAMLQQPRVPPTGQRQAIEVHIKWREVLDYKRDYLRLLSIATGWEVDKLDADMQRPLYMRPQVSMSACMYASCGGHAECRGCCACLMRWQVLWNSSV